MSETFEGWFESQYEWSCNEYDYKELSRKTWNHCEERVEKLQAALKIANEALSDIEYGNYYCPDAHARQALTEIEKLNS